MLNSLRDRFLPLKTKLIQQGKLAMMTQGYVLTELGYGACQEMGDRFVFEYLTRFRDCDISQVHTINHVTKDTHLLILVASGELPDFNEFNTPGKYQNPLHAFIEAQPEDCILVDPYSNLCGPAKDYKQILLYNQQNNISQILTANTYLPNASAVMSHLPGVTVEGNPVIQLLKSEELKACLKQCAAHVGLTEVDWIYHSKYSAYYLAYGISNLDKINYLVELFSKGGVGQLQKLTNKKKKLFLAFPAAFLSIPKLQRCINTLTQSSQQADITVCP